jgi:hypothetical protein
MLLSDVFKQLAYGEFAGIALGNAHGDGILEIDYPKVIASINLGLSELHKRFPLRHKEVFIQLYSDMVEYQIHSKYAVSNGEDSPFEVQKYIIDSPTAPFVDDILKIEEVYSSCGEALFLNNDKECRSVYTTSFRTLQVPCEIREKTSVLSVLYRADHQTIPLDTTNPEEIEIELGSAHIEALMYYVASRILNNTVSLAGTSDGQVFMQKFEMSCANIERFSLYNKTDPTNTRLEDAGWA